MIQVDVTNNGLNQYPVFSNVIYWERVSITSGVFAKNASDSSVYNKQKTTLNWGQSTKWLMIYQITDLQI